MEKITEEQMYETHLLLHKLWTSQAGTEGYNKEDWKRLEWLVDRLIDMSAGTVEFGGWLAKIEKQLGANGMNQVQNRVRRMNRIAGGRYEKIDDVREAYKENRPFQLTKTISFKIVKIIEDTLADLTVFSGEGEIRGCCYHRGEGLVTIYHG